MNHKEKLKATKELKKNFFFHMKEIYQKYPFDKIILEKKTINSMWGMVSCRIQSSYAKGYDTGYKRELVEAGKILGIKKKEVK